MEVSTPISFSIFLDGSLYRVIILAERGFTSFCDVVGTGAGVVAGGVVAGVWVAGAVVASCLAGSSCLTGGV
ncbi:hypothetical protein JCM17380_24740 [Desulfosporosinus burensis]